MSDTSNIPQKLINEIRSGNCVAFVGAGFSVPTIPPWNMLLKNIASRIEEQEGGTLAKILADSKSGASNDLEAAAHGARGDVHKFIS